jgi:hypothetical protein
MIDNKGYQNIVNFHQASYSVCHPAFLFIPIGGSLLDTIASTWKYQFMYYFMNCHVHFHVIVNPPGPSHKMLGVEDFIIPQKMGCTMLIEKGCLTCLIFYNMATR